MNDEVADVQAGKGGQTVKANQSTAEELSRYWVWLILV